MVFLTPRFLILVSISLSFVKCAKILGIFPAPGYSQYIIGSGLMIPLAERGHEVTVISQHQTTGVENFKNLLIAKEKELYNSEDMLEMRKSGIFEAVDAFHAYGEDITEKVLSDDNVQKLLNSNKTFDLVISEIIVNTEALMTIATLFNAKLIIVSTMGLGEWMGSLIGNIMPPSYVPAVPPGYTSKMSFTQRTINTVVYLYDGFKRKYVGLPKQQKLINKYFPKPFSVYEAIDRIDLLLLNSHPAVTGVLPLTHAVKEIGDFHIPAPKQLPADIKAFLDSADKGAVLFSMGSNLKSADLPKAVLEKLIGDFGKLPQKVLWKFEASILDLPKNVMVSKWLPQRDILGHPNMVAFISHGGLLSSTEAIHYGVPLVGIPVFIDQFMNVQRLVNYGVAVHVPFDNLSDGSLIQALHEVISNVSYKKNAMERSKILRDRLVRPLDEAIYWVEYVLRHNNTLHLRSPELDLTWYQAYLLDVIGLFVGVLCCVGIIIKYTCSVICVKKSECKSFDNKKNNKKEKKI